MRIAIFTEVFLPKIDGVVTRVTRSLEQLRDAGHEVLIFTPGSGPKTYAGFEVVYLPALSLWPVYPEIKFSGPWPSLFRRLKAFKPDVVHAVNPIWTAALGVLAARRLGLPIVASFHTNVPEYVDDLGIGFVRPLTERAIRYLHNQAEVNLCTSGPMVDKARAMGMRNVQLWPKAVDTVGFAPGRASDEMRSTMTSGHPAAPLVTYVGRVSKEKNLHILPAVMEKLRGHLPGARLAVVGGGPFLKQLKSQCSPEWATFTGFMSGDDLAAAFASGDVFAFPSLTETLGLVALESFASGTPVVGARAGGIPFIIEDGVTGRLVDCDGDADAVATRWAQALYEILSDGDARVEMGRRAREEAEKYSWKESTRVLIDAYAQAAAR